MKRFVEFLKHQPPGRLITTGFAVVILLGALLLLLPCSVKEGAGQLYRRSVYIHQRGMRDRTDCH